MKKFNANTRTVIKPNYALITEDSYVQSKIPGWEKVDVRIVISPAIGANFSQQLIRLNTESIISGKTTEAQIFFYVIKGKCSVTIEGRTKQPLTQGGFVYVPIGEAYTIENGSGELVSFQKEYERLATVELPKVVWGNVNDVINKKFLEDDQLYMKYLLADDLSMDFAVNIFTYKPGGNLPFVESHIMQHGLLFLQGEGIYRLDDDWYSVGKGDVIWMAPYCPQWFAAIGKEDAVYIYCKDINRPAITG